jgi:hypothetical protein
LDWGQVRVIRSNDIERTKKLSLPEYPEIASHIKQAIDDVYYGIKDPKICIGRCCCKIG